MNKEQLDAIKERVAKMSPKVAEIDKLERIAFQDVPALISEVERLEKERAALEFHLKVSSCALEIEGAKADKFQRALEKIDDDIGIITSKEISEIVEKALEGTMALGDDDCS